MKGPIRVLVPALLILIAAGTAGAQEFTKYHTYAETTAIVQGLAKSAPGLVKLTSLGKTLEKRDLWVLEIASPAGVPPAERPGLLIAANFSGDTVFGSELALAVADYLVKNASKPEVKACLDNAVVYIVPRMNPDGAEAMWASLKWARRTNATPFDDDNDGRTDEDGPEDLNGDGLITVMRVAEPGGRIWSIPRTPVCSRKPTRSSGRRASMPSTWKAGTTTATDSSTKIPPGGVNLNRNFMHEYPYFKAEAGRFMASETETRALLGLVGPAPQHRRRFNLRRERQPHRFGPDLLRPPARPSGRSRSERRRRGKDRNLPGPRSEGRHADQGRRRDGNVHHSRDFDHADGIGRGTIHDGAGSRRSGPAGTARDSDIGTKEHAGPHGSDFSFGS